MSLRFKFNVFLGFVVFTTLLACKPSSKSVKVTSTKKYSLYILAKDGKNYLLETDSLTNGILAPETNGLQIDDDKISRADLVKDGFYYDLDSKESKFAKYEIEDEKLKEVGSLTLKNFSIENYNWLGGDTLLLMGLNRIKDSEMVYSIITTSNMKEVKAGKMDIPKPTGVFNNISVGVVKRRSNKLLVGYTYHQLVSPYNYRTNDTIYFSALKYPQMTAERISKDTRSTYPGGVNTIQPYSFKDEQGNYYFMNCPGIALGNRPELPTALMRINVGEDQPDAKYFFNLSTSVINNHAYGMWYLGNGKAIIRSEQKDLFKDLNDHYEIAHFSYYLIDVATRKVINRLNLPLDRGTRKNCIIIEGDYVYIAINSKTDGNYIWQYHIKTKKLKKGLRLVGDTDYILRIDPLRKE